MLEPAAIEWRAKKRQIPQRGMWDLAGTPNLTQRGTNKSWNGGTNKKL